MVGLLRRPPFRLQPAARLPNLWLGPTAIAHFRPRSSLRAFFKQYYRYSRGDGKADLWRKRHAIRYGAYAVGGLCSSWVTICTHSSGCWRW